MSSQRERYTYNKPQHRGRQRETDREKFLSGERDGGKRRADSSTLEIPSRSHLSVANHRIQLATSVSNIPRPKFSYTQPESLRDITNAANNAPAGAMAVPATAGDKSTQSTYLFPPFPTN